MIRSRLQRTTNQIPDLVFSKIKLDGAKHLQGYIQLTAILFHQL